MPSGKKDSAIMSVGDVASTGGKAEQLTSAPFTERDKRQAAGYIAGLHEETREALRSYTGSGSDINKALREGQDISSRQDYVGCLDHAIQEYALPHDTRVWRNGSNPWNLSDPQRTEEAKQYYQEFLEGIKNHERTEQLLKDLYQGRTLDDLAYFSTTIDPEAFTADMMHRMELVAPEGAKGLYVESVSQSPLLVTPTSRPYPSPSFRA